MKSYSSILFIAIVLITTAACSQNENIQSEPPSQNSDYLGLSSDVYNTLSPEEKSLRKQSLIMAEHTILTGTKYHIDISESSANQLGVTSEYYKKIISHIDAINQEIAQMISIGAKVQLADLKKSIRKTKILSKNTARGTYIKEGPIVELISEDGRIDSVLVYDQKEKSVWINFDIDVMADVKPIEAGLNTLYVSAESKLFRDHEYFTLENENCHINLNLKARPSGLNNEFTLKMFSSYHYAIATGYISPSSEIH